MLRPRKVVVLGAGTMGAQVAAHLVGQGLEVVVLDLRAPDGEPNALARRECDKDCFRCGNSYAGYDVGDADAGRKSQ